MKNIELIISIILATLLISYMFCLMYRYYKRHIKQDDCIVRYGQIKGQNMRLLKENKKLKEAFDLTVLKHTKVVAILRNDKTLSLETKKRLDGLI